MSTVRIGTSGWSYPSGPGKWNGLFYPATRSKKAGTAGLDVMQHDLGAERRRHADRRRADAAAAAGDEQCLAIEFDHEPWTFPR